jgi:SAM-dependent methyltransferase
MTVKGVQPEAGPSERDPLAIFFGDPYSHLSDVLYLYFRHYKRQLIHRFFLAAAVARTTDGPLAVADVGASMGFDMKYVFSLITEGRTKPPAWGDTVLSLLEGDETLIRAGEIEWAKFGDPIGVRAHSLKCDLTERLPLPDMSQDIVLCSEVVEHLVHPERLFLEVHRVLKPTGRFILTTDNCPSALQWIRRIPVWLAGQYRRSYRRPEPDSDIVGAVVIGGVARPIYGHINLNPTRYWERMVKESGFAIASFGTYESVRRGGGTKSPVALAAYFTLGFLVSLMPRRLGRFFGDTTALLLRKV